MSVKIIDSFSQEYFWLSNFAPSPINIFDHLLNKNMRVPTVEHGFQADKTLHPEERRNILLSTSPQAAKKLGQSVSLREDWEDIKLNRMKQWLRLKFQIPELKKKLLQTGEIQLIDENTWNDIYWGMCRGEGENHLGKLLMELRNNLRIGKNG